MNDESEDTLVRITLRLPRDLHRKLTSAAAENSHSMNAEIIAQLELASRWSELGPMYISTVRRLGTAVLTSQIATARAKLDSGIDPVADRHEGISILGKTIGPDQDDNVERVETFDPRGRALLAGVYDSLERIFGSHEGALEMSNEAADELIQRDAERGGLSRSSKLHKAPNKKRPRK